MIFYEFPVPEHLVFERNGYLAGMSFRCSEFL